MSIGIGIDLALGASGLRLAGGGWSADYNLYDTFATDLAAGTVNGTSAEPGPGTRTLVDAGNRISLKFSEMLYAVGGNEQNTTWRDGPFTPEPGLCLIAHVRQDIVSTANLIASLGFDNNDSTYVEANRFQFTTSAALRIANSIYFGAYTSVGTYAVMTLYSLAVVYLDTKVAYCIKGGEWADWTLLGALTKHAATSVYVAINAYNRAFALKAVALAVLPEPWHSDSLADAALTSSAKTMLNQVAPLTLLTTAAIQQIFTPSAAGSVGIERSGDDYWLWQEIGDGRKWYVKLKALVSPSVIHALDASEIRDSASVVVADLYDGGSVWEYAYDDGVAMVGNAHGFDTQTSLTIEVDGVPVTLLDTESDSGSEIVVTRVSNVTMSDGTTPLGVATVTYTMAPLTGLTVNVNLAWSITTVVAGMTPYADLCDIGYLVYPSGKYYDMTAWTSVDINYDLYSTDCALAFDRNGSAAICMIATEGARNMQHQDRGALNKMYSYAGNGQFETNHRAVWLSSTTDLLR